MSGENDGYAVGVEMDELGEGKEFADLDCQPVEEKTVAEVSFRVRFESILMDYSDEKTWWVAVENLPKKDSDFAEKIMAKLTAEEEKPREKAIIEVMVDLLLDMEGMTVHRGLVYVLDEGLQSYPMELMVVELLKRGANPNEERGTGGSTPLHLAIAEEKVELVKMLLEKGAYLETVNDNGCTPFLEAVKYGASEEIVDLLLEHDADVHTLTEDRKTALHFAAQKDDEVTMRKMMERDPLVDAKDKDGWTPLHEAAYYGSKGAAGVLIEKGASVSARDHRKQTPLHVAAEGGDEEVIALLLDKNADSHLPDIDGNTPLDLAAKERFESAVNLLSMHTCSSKKDDAVKKTLETAMGSERVKDDLVKEKIGVMSPDSVVSMFKPKKCGGKEEYKFLEQFVSNSKLKKSTKAIMDHFVLGKRRGRVNCEIIEADKKGIPPDQDDFDESSQSLLDVIVEQNDKELAQHPSIKAILDYKWKTFGRWLFVLSFMVYAVRMMLFGVALLIAARPDLDNPGCYRDGWDYFRGVCEGISMILFLVKLGDEIQEMLSFPKLYFKDYYNYAQLVSVILPFLIIPFRAATTWCASTGDGYCVDPTLLPNSTNVSLDINMACITASHVQWIIASLAYMANAFLVMEFLALFSTTGVYARILLRIIVSDMLKFIVIFTVILYIFVGSFYLSLRAGVSSVNITTGAIDSDLEVFSLETLYPWHVVFTGIRILIEAGDILNGNYFANNDEGQYIGYQWFSIVLYLAFLFIVIVVLLNLLIAQMSDTYTKVQEDVEGTFAIARARIISRLQKGKWLFCKETYRKRFFKKYVWTELTDEELKQDEQEEQAEGKVALAEMKIDRLSEMAAENTRRLQNREDTALQYKSLVEQKINRLREMAAENARMLRNREDTALQYKSLIEQKIDQLDEKTAENTRRLLNREDTALQYKSVLEQKVDLLTEMTALGLDRREGSAQNIRSGLEQKVDHLTEMTAHRLQDREDSAQTIKSAMEQKVDHATEMTVQGLQKREDSAQHIKSLLEQKIDQMSVEFTRKLQEREDTALQYNRLLEQKVHQLNEMTTENSRRLQEREDTALQYKSVLEQKIDRLYEVAAEMTKLLKGEQESGPAPSEDKQAHYGKKNK